MKSTLHINTQRFCTVPIYAEFSRGATEDKSKRSLYLVLFRTCQEPLTVLDSDTVGLLGAPHSSAAVPLTMVLQGPQAPDNFIMSSRGVGPEHSHVQADFILHEDFFFFYVFFMLQSGIMCEYFKKSCV